MSKEPWRGPKSVKPANERVRVGCRKCGEFTMVALSAMPQAAEDWAVSHRPRCYSAPIDPMDGLECEGCS